MSQASVGEALAAAIDAIAAAGSETPRLDAEILLEHCTGFDRVRFAAEPDLPMPRGSGREFAGFVRRRVAREPVAYITGHKGFRRVLLECDRRALIPRPETELLVELALELAAEQGGEGPLTVADIGTGTGAVALALADELQAAEIVATDTSDAALVLAAHNAHRLGLGDRVSFVAGSVPEGRFDLVLANLPYIADGEWPELAPEIVSWEPREALLAGHDGLDAIRAVAGGLGPDGSGAGCEAPVVAFEIGERQADAVRELLASRGYERTEVRRDLAGADRVIVGRSGRTGP